MNILWYDGKSTNKQTQNERDAVAVALPHIVLHIFDNTKTAIAALSTRQFDAIVTTTELSPNWVSDGRQSGMLIQDAVVALGLSTPRILLAENDSYIRKLIKRRYSQTIPVPTVVARSSNFVDDLTRALRLIYDAEIKSAAKKKAKRKVKKKSKKKSLHGPVRSRSPSPTPTLPSPSA